MNRLRSFLARKSRPNVVVQLKGGTSIKGVLYGVYGDVLVVIHASAAPAGAKDFTPVDGEQAIPHANVDWIQVVGPGESQ